MDRRLKHIGCWISGWEMDELKMENGWKEEGMKGGREEKESERTDRWKFGWMDGWVQGGGRERGMRVYKNGGEGIGWMLGKWME